jgi:hypothetical protein
LITSYFGSGFLDFESELYPKELLSGNFKFLSEAISCEVCLRTLNLSFSLGNSTEDSLTGSSKVAVKVGSSESMGNMILRLDPKLSVVSILFFFIEI